MISSEKPQTGVIQLRVALTVRDFERSLRFYSQGLGIEPAAFWNNDGGRAVMVELGQATLEIFDEVQAQVIDHLEAGERVSGQVRFALQVPNLDEAIKRLVNHGARLVHEPVVTPWGDRNARVIDPDGMQVTLFEVEG